MKATIHLTSPAGVPITLEIGATADRNLIIELIDRADQIGQYYAGQGWTLGHDHAADTGTGPSAAELAQGPTFAGYPCSPTVDDAGIPTWIIVNGVQAQRREKQGDVWFSAKMPDGTYMQTLRIPKGEKAPEVKGL